MTTVYKKRIIRVLIWLCGLHQRALARSARSYRKALGETIELEAKATKRVERLRAALDAGL